MSILPPNYDETYYLIGIDVGNDSSAIAFFNLSTNEPEPIDLSGGYGKPSIPTAVQFIQDTGEWVFGEYAILNSQAGEVFTSLPEKLGKNEYVSINGSPVSIAEILGLFVKELILNVKNINPKAEIAGIVANVPAYFSEEASNEFKQVFKHAGFYDKLLGFYTDRECVLANFYQAPPQNEETVLILDFSNRELRGSLYRITEDSNQIGAKSIASFFDEKVSMAAIDNKTHDLFELLLLNMNKNVSDQFDYPEQMTAFTFSHKDILFQKNIRAKPAKLYFNFAYPPVQQTLNYETVDDMIKPFKSGLNSFVHEVFNKSIETSVSIADITMVHCVGGGFEMLWAREIIESLFSKSRINFYKNPKLITAIGASVIAARHAGINLPEIQMIDNHQLDFDFGFLDGTNFLPFAYRNSFWWQKHESKILLVGKEIINELELTIAFKDKDNKPIPFKKILLSGLPKRPKNVTKLIADINFYSGNDLTLTISDGGFGELFPKVDYRQVFEFRVS